MVPRPDADLPFEPNAAGYASIVGLLGGTLPESWRRNRLFRVLSLGGYVAFDLPRVVTGLGVALLLGIAATHAYLMTSQPAVPWYLLGYATATIAGCVIALVAMVAGRNPRVAQAGWSLGSSLCVTLLCLAVGSRLVELPGLAAMTGRLDFAPATFIAAFAVGFVALHASVLLGINVAFPQRRHWVD